MRLPGIGSQYLFAMLDSNKNHFDGGKTYKVMLPKGIPEENFWSFTVYDNMTRSMLDGMDDFWRMRAWLDISALREERRARILPFIVAWAKRGATLSGERVFRGYSQMAAMRGGKYTTDNAKQDNLKTETLKGLVDQELIAQQADDLGIRVGDAEVADAIARSPQFQQDGKFDFDYYKRLVENGYGMSVTRFEEAYRRDLLRGKVVQAAIGSGVGTRVKVNLGAKHDDLHGLPIPVEGLVRCITDGRFVLRAMLSGLELDLGPSCRLTVDDVDIVVTSKPFQTIDPEVFLLHGIDVSRYKVIGLKSSQHFRAGFRDLASLIVTADSPGLTTNRVDVFEHVRARRPLWPISPEARYVG